MRTQTFNPKFRENAELKSKLVTISMLAKDTELPF